MRRELVFGAAATLVLGLTALQGIVAEEYVPECGPPQPAEVQPVDIHVPAPGVARLSWPTQAGYYADIVRGSLQKLFAGAGDYTVSTEKCLLNDSLESTFDDPDVPPEEEGYWYLIRPDQYAGCIYAIIGYNSTEGCQVGVTNAEIRASGHDCPCAVLCAHD